MQDSAKHAVGSMDATEKAVDQGVVKAQEAADSILQLKEGAVNTASVVEEISGAISEQQMASSTIADHIEQVAQMSEQNTAASSASASAISNMSSVCRELTRGLSLYKIDSAEKKIVLRVADIHNEEHPAVRAVRYMAEQLDQRTQGRITLKIYSGGSWGSEKEALDQLQSGGLDMTRVMSGALNKTCPSTVVLGLPFVFQSVSHMQRAMDGAPGEEILASLADQGFIGLGFYDGGARSIYSNKPINSIRDVQGMRLRVLPGSDLWMAVASAMGAKGVPMSLDEIVSGLQTGLIDAAENNIVSYVGFKHHQVFKYFSQTEHSMAPDVLVFSKKTWDMLSPADQEIIRDVGKKSVPIMRRYWSEREDSSRKAAISNGSTFVTNVDKSGFQGVMKPVYTRFVTSEKQKALLRAIQDIK